MPQSASTPTPISATPEPLPPTAHTDVAFSDMRYERPDTDAIERALQTLLHDISSGKSPESLLAGYERIKAMYDQADAQMSLAYLLYAFDVTEEYYEQEYIRLQSVLTTLDLTMTEATIALAESSKKAAALLDSAYGEGYVDAVYAGESLNSDAVQELMNTDSALVTEYDRLTNSFQLEDNGRLWTLDEIIYDDSLSVREYYRLYDAYCAAFNASAGEIYIRMLDVRSQIAKILGYGSYAAYQYDCYGRDYSVTDAKALHAAVKKYIVPVFISANGFSNEPDAETFSGQEQGGGLLSEWKDFLDILLDNQADQKRSQPPVDDLSDLYTLSYAVYDLDEYLSALSGAAEDFSPSLSEALDFMLRNQLYNFSVNPKKMTGSFTTYLSQYQSPFIFTQWTNSATSVDTVIHEFGHFANYYHNPNSGWSQGDSLDLAEVDSQALQLLMTPYYPRLYGETYAKAAEFSLLLDCMYALITGCMEDEFQQAAYGKPNMTLEEMNAVYLRLAREYGLADLYGYTGTEWVLVPHTFQTPMYYISYAVSMVPALELWRLSLSDVTTARTAYLKILNRSPYASFRDTLVENGLPDVFEPDTIAGIAALLDEQM